MPGGKVDGIGDVGPGNQSLGGHVAIIEDEPDRFEIDGAIILKRRRNDEMGRRDAGGSRDDGLVGGNDTRNGRPAAVANQKKAHTRGDGGDDHGGDQGGQDSRQRASFGKEPRTRRGKFFLLGQKDLRRFNRLLSDGSRDGREGGDWGRMGEDSPVHGGGKRIG